MLYDLDKTKKFVQDVAGVFSTMADAIDSQLKEIDNLRRENIDLRLQLLSLRARQPTAPGCQVPSESEDAHVGR